MNEDKDFLYQILQSLSRLEVKVEEIKEISKVASQAKDLAQEASQRSQNNREKIAKLESDYAELRKELETIRSSSSSKWEKYWEKMFLMGLSIAATVICGHYFHF